MNKNEIYVPINNRKEAKQAKAVLKALSEPTSSSFYNKYYDENCHLYFNKIHSEWVVSLSPTYGHEEITLKQFVKLLVSESDNSAKGNDTLGKIAVKVENQKEFKALMKYYDSLGYVWNGGDKPLSKESLPSYPNAIKFEDKFQHSTGKECADYQIIPFAEFAEEKGIKFPLLTSEDGVDLFEGEKYHGIGKSYGEWSYYNEYDVHEAHKEYLQRSPNDAKAFSTKQAALSWIESQKPKSIYYDFNPACYVIADNTGIYINDNGLGIKLGTGQLHKINSMMEELNNG